MIRLNPRSLILLGCALLLSCVAAAHASGEDLSQEPVRLTVDDAIERALRANRELEINRLQLESERRIAESAWNRFLPSLSASSSLSRQLPDRDSDPYSVSLGTQTSLSLSLAKIREGRNAMLEYERGQISYQQAEGLLRRDVRRAYYALLVQQEKLRIKRDAVETAEMRYRRSEAEYEDGLVSRYTVLSDRVSRQRLLPELGALQDDLRSAEAEFALLLGYPRETRIELQDELEVEIIELDRERMIAIYRDTRPAVRSEELRLEEDELAERLARERNVPSLSLSYSFSRTHATPFSDSWVDRDSWSSSGQAQVSLSLSLDRLFPGSEARVAAENRERRMAERELRLIDLREEAAEEIERLVRRVERAEEALEVRRLTKETAELAYELAEQEYEDGFLDALELRNAALELEETRLSVLEEQLRVLNAYAELEYLLGDHGRGL